jgi:MFS family permease
MTHRKVAYKWVALSNTTLAMLAYSFNQTIVLVALPAIFAGLQADPLSKGGAGYLLWVMSSYTVATTVLLATFGRIADIHGKVRFYKIGFVIFGVASLLCALTPSTGTTGALELIIFRLLQGVGGAMLSATGIAILTDAFPANERGLAFAINQLAFIGGNVFGVVLGGLLATVNWRLVFLISVPIGFGGALWSHRKLREIGSHHAEPPDWWGNLLFGSAMVLVMLAITYALVPYGGSSTGWGNPLVLLALLLGVGVFATFFLVERRVAYPLFNLALLRIRAFTAANIANFAFTLSRGGLQFILIVWLQGVWMPLHGVSFAAIPLTAGLALLPMMAGFLVAAPIGGWLADRHGARLLSTTGLSLLAVSLLLLATLPADFALVLFAVYLFLVGIGMGLFAAPNSTQLMGSVDAGSRGIAAGMRQTIGNAGQLLSTAIFLTIVVGGLAAVLPTTLKDGLIRVGVPPAAAQSAAAVPAGTAVFSAVLGYNPIDRLLPPSSRSSIPPRVIAEVTGGQFFARLIAEPVAAAMHIAFLAGAAFAVCGVFASLLRGPRVRFAVAERGSDAAELEPVLSET